MRLQLVLYYSDYMALARQINVSHKYFLNSDHNLRYSLIFEVDVPLRFAIKKMNFAKNKYFFTRFPNVTVTVRIVLKFLR